MRFWLVQRKVLAVVGVLSAFVLALFLTTWHGVGLEPPPTEDVAAVVPETVAGENDASSDGAAAPGVLDAAADHNGRTYADDYYVEYRLERERSRGRQVELLRSIIEDPKAGPEARQNAQDRLLQISLELDREVSVENILRAKGLPDAVVFFQNEMVTVVVPHPVTPEQGTTVVNLVARATGIVPENIMVIARGDERL